MLHPQERAGCMASLSWLCHGLVTSFELAAPLACDVAGTAAQHSAVHHVPVGGTAVRGRRSAAGRLWACSCAGCGPHARAYTCVCMWRFGTHPCQVEHQSRHQRPGRGLRRQPLRRIRQPPTAHLHTAEGSKQAMERRLTAAAGLASRGRAQRRRGATSLPGSENASPSRSCGCRGGALTRKRHL
jgi:hypothetical protein